jgi:hypothetical protein
VRRVGQLAGGGAWRAKRKLALRRLVLVRLRLLSAACRCRSKVKGAGSPPWAQAEVKLRRPCVAQPMASGPPRLRSGASVDRGERRALPATGTEGGYHPAPEPVERGVVGSDVLEPAAPSAPSPAALPASPCTAWMESD